MLQERPEEQEEWSKLLSAGGNGNGGRVVVHTVRTPMVHLHGLHQGHRKHNQLCISVQGRWFW